MSVNNITKKPQFQRNQALSLVSEHSYYNQKLHQRNLFPYITFQNRSNIVYSIISFRFRSIEFSKKRALPFFLAIELLTHRKCIASLSKRNVQSWKIRKGMLVGCKVTLRQEGLYSFIDTLLLTLPRMEKFQPTNWSFKIFKSIYSKIAVTNKFAKNQPNYALNLGELVLFYPIELGLGLHPDVQQVQLNFVFSSLSIEERFFLLRSFKIPILF